MITNKQNFFFDINFIILREVKMLKTKQADWLNRLYLANPSEACEMMADQNCLKHILLPKNMLILFRYIQNLPSLDSSAVLRTFLLIMQLSRFHSSHFRQVFSNTNFNSLTLNPKLSKQDETYFYGIVHKVAQHIQFCCTKVEIAPQLELLTQGIFFLTHGCKNKNLMIYGQFFESIIQQMCLQFWEMLQEQMMGMEEMQEADFMQFYKKYSSFCSSRRKIPKISNKNLKNIQISRETNQKIQSILKQYKDKETELKNKELTLKPRSGVAKILALMEDFDQDDE